MASTNSTNASTTATSVEVISKGKITEDSDHTMAYVLVPLGVLAFVALLAFIVMLIIRKNRMERLRHHLMPLYNFDPQEEEWESELLDDRGRRMYSRDVIPSSTSPQLQFNT